MRNSLKKIGAKYLVAAAATPFNWGAIDSAFRSVSKILFGTEVGSLKDFEPYLREAMFPYLQAKSFISGKPVYLSNPFYPKGASFAAPGEQGAKASKFSINDIKDIDSLFRAASEQAVYCGNKVFRKNFNYDLVDNAIDCTNVYCCHNVRNVKNGAYLSYVREAEYVFGTPAYPKARYTIRCVEGINLVRGFETHYSTHSSDMYYSFNCSNCTEGIFAFNLRGKHRVIGNNELAPEKYAPLKKKLISEIAEGLRRKKRAFSLVELPAWAGKGKDDEVAVPPLPAPRQVEEAFRKTTGLLFGKERNGLEGYAPWLKKRALGVSKVRGKFGTPTYKVELPVIKDLPAACLCTLEEALENNKPLANEAELSLPVRQLAEKIGKKAVFTLEFVDGMCENTPDVSAVFDSVNVYSMWDATSSTLCGCSTAMIQSRYCFGGSLRILDSQFCINCFDPVNLRLCFESDGCSDCSSCYFCHNCEGCEECLFCFNAKGLHHAIFNKEVPREEYARIKKMLLDYVNAELDKKKDVEQSIFSLKP